jgi:hypothetical protein
VKNLLVARVDPNLDRVWDWYQFQLKLTLEARSHVLQLRGSGVVWIAQRQYDSEFLGRELDWVKRFFDRQIGELDLMTMLEMLSTTEAALRLDFLDRVQRRQKDLVARRFREIAKEKTRTSLDEDILETWRSEGGVKVGPFRGSLKLRDWLAHGRHWTPLLAQGYDPAAIYQISRDLLAALPF